MEGQARPLTSHVGPNGNSGVILRVSSAALGELGWELGTVVHWRIVDGHLEGHPVVLQERR